MILGNVGGLAGTWSGFLGYIIGPYRVLPESDLWRLPYQDSKIWGPPTGQGHKGPVSEAWVSVRLGSSMTETMLLSLLLALHPRP